MSPILLYIRSAVFGFLAFVAVVTVANNTGTLRKAVDYVFAGR